MTEKGQEQGRPCWVVAGPFAARLGLSKSQRDVLTRCWWLLPCQAFAFRAGVRPPVNVTLFVTALLLRRQSGHSFGQVQEGPCSCRPGQSRVATTNLSHCQAGFLLPDTTAAASSGIQMFLSRNESLMVVVCWARICTSVCRHSHEFLKHVGCGLGDFCHTSQTPAAMSCWCYVKNKKQSTVLATRVSFSLAFELYCINQSLAH